MEHKNVLRSAFLGLLAHDYNPSQSTRLDSSLLTYCITRQKNEVNDPVELIFN